MDSVCVLASFGGGGGGYLRRLSVQTFPRRGGNVRADSVQAFFPGEGVSAETVCADFPRGGGGQCPRRLCRLSSSPEHPCRGCVSWVFGGPCLARGFTQCNSTNKKSPLRLAESCCVHTHEEEKSSWQFNPNKLHKREMLMIKEGYFHSLWTPVFISCDYIEQLTEIKKIIM